MNDVLSSCKSVTGRVGGVHGFERPLSTCCNPSTLRCSLSLIARAQVFQILAHLQLDR